MNAVLLNLIIIYCGVCAGVKPESPCAREKHRNSFLWKLKREPPVYFFGTIHVPYTRVWDYIPTNTRKAFEKSENVYFELDLSDVRTGIALSRCKELPLGKEIQEVLPPDIYLRLRRHLNYVRRAMTSWVTSKQVEQGLTARLMYNELVGGWERKRPIWIMLMINALTKPDIRSRGLPVLDVYLARQAEMTGKRTGAIEKVEEQCRPFNGLNMSQVLFALNHTLTLQEKIRRGKMRLPYSTDDLINTYNCGDLNSLIFGKGTSQIPNLKNSDVKNNETGHKLSGVEITTADTAMASEIDEYLKEELIFRRNERMATRVIDLIRRNEDESFFFAFGAGHFLGNGSVIDYVTKAGFEIERVDGEFDPRSDTQSGLTSLKGSWGRGKNKRKHKRQGGRRRKSGRRHKSRASRRRSKKKKKNANEGRKKQDFWSRLGKSRSGGLDDAYFRYYQDTADSRSQIRIVNRLPTPSYDVTERNNLDSIFRFSWSPDDSPAGGRQPSGYDVMDMWNWDNGMNNGACSTPRNKELIITCLYVIITSIVVVYCVTESGSFDCDTVSYQQREAAKPDNRRILEFKQSAIVPKRTISTSSSR